MGAQTLANVKRKTYYDGVAQTILAVLMTGAKTLHSREKTVLATVLLASPDQDSPRTVLGA